ncbi:hypothetical protein KR018_003427 [Drosophila ironensis]|nr:hypothetical protein KR018_003427 [Drosophila ironensis]
MLNLASTKSNMIFSQLLLALLVLSDSNVQASDNCIFCQGINCLRSTYAAEEQCSDQLDACVSVFQGGIVQAQGCWESLPDDFKKKCKEYSDVDCEICVTEKCNTLGSKKSSCLQCNSEQDSQCSEAPETIEAQQCGIARTGRSFCYSKIESGRLERGCLGTLSSQMDCLANQNCNLCDPLEVSKCNNLLMEEDTTTTPTEKPSETTTTEPTATTQSSEESETPTTEPTSTTQSSEESTTSQETSSTTNFPTISPTDPTTNSPTSTTEPPTTTEKPNSANQLHFSVVLILAQLALWFYNLHK